MPSALKGTKVQVSYVFRAYHHSLAAEVNKILVLPGSVGLAQATGFAATTWPKIPVPKTGHGDVTQQGGNWIT